RPARPAHGGHRRALRAPRLLPLPRHPIGRPPGEGAGARPPGVRRRLRRRHRPALDGGLLAALRRPAVQALLDARWAEGGHGRAVAAGLLAHAERRLRRAVASRDRRTEPTVLTPGRRY